LAVGILWFCGKNRFDSAHVWRWIGRHLLAALLFSLCYVTALSWLLAGEISVQTGEILTFSYLLKKMGLHYVALNLMMYWLVVLGHLGWHYYTQYREREVVAAQLQKELVEARLQALRMQLNPHFLFNALHAVSALIHDNPDLADRVLARLSDLLRLSLDQSKPQEVPLHEEFAFLDHYLEIEQTRFADRLEVQKQVEPGAENALVPFLILQPLVENAIRHGIEPSPDPGLLRIQAVRKNGELHLRVSDNGMGLSNWAKTSKGEGIGLSNTRSRLKHLYGAAFRMEVREATPRGVETIISIPFHERLSPN
jgi:LytS/YehU family sensor histidine kinase